jgi:hypothetical protein
VLNEKEQAGFGEYRRAGKLEHVSDGPTVELAAIREEVAGRA